MLYHCATACPTNIRGLNYKPFSHHFSRLVPAVRLEPMILGIWLKCPTVLLQIVHLTSEASITTFSRHFLSPGVSGEIWTHDLRNMSQMLYHCPLVPAVRFEPTILRILLKCCTIVLQLVQLTSEASIIKLFPRHCLSPGASSEILTHHFSDTISML